MTQMPERIIVNRVEADILSKRRISLARETEYTRSDAILATKEAIVKMAERIAGESGFGLQSEVDAIAHRILAAVEKGGDNANI